MLFSIGGIQKLIQQLVHVKVNVYFFSTSTRQRGIVQMRRHVRQRITHEVEPGAEEIESRHGVGVGVGVGERDRRVQGRTQGRARPGVRRWCRRAGFYRCRNDRVRGRHERHERRSRCKHRTSHGIESRPEHRSRRVNIRSEHPTTWPSWSRRCQSRCFRHDRISRRRHDRHSRGRRHDRQRCGHKTGRTVVRCRTHATTRLRLRLRLKRSRGRWCRSRHSTRGTRVRTTSRVSKSSHTRSRRIRNTRTRSTKRRARARRHRSRESRLGRGARRRPRRGHMGRPRSSKRDRAWSSRWRCRERARRGHSCVSCGSQSPRCRHSPRYRIRSRQSRRNELAKDTHHSPGHVSGNHRLHARQHIDVLLSPTTEKDKVIREALDAGQFPDGEDIRSFYRLAMSACFYSARGKTRKGAEIP